MQALGLGKKQLFITVQARLCVKGKKIKNEGKGGREKRRILFR